MKVLPQNTDEMRLLALTASLVAARPIGLGEHEIIKASAQVSQAVPTR